MMRLRITRWGCQIKQGLGYVRTKSYGHLRGAHIDLKNDKYFQWYIQEMELFDVRKTSTHKATSSAV